MSQSPAPGKIAIPSAKDVRAAERQQQAVPNYFQPRGLAAAGQRAEAPAPQAAQPVHDDPMAFLGGGTQRLPPRLPPPQAQPQQHQQWQQREQQQEQRPPAAQQFGQQRQPPPYLPQQQQQQQQGRRNGTPLQPPPQWQAPPARLPPVLKHIRNVRWQFGDIVPDYLLGRDAACLFLSLRFHMLKPEYIHHRIRELQRSFRLRVILCHVDTEDAVEPLAQVTRAAIGNDCTLVCGWSNQECARYLETFKSYENKPAEVIQKDVGHDYVSRVTAALTTIRGVNKTDVKTLGDRFGSVAGILSASAADLQACPGIGPTKARRLYEAFHEPFRRQVVPALQSPEAAVPATRSQGGEDGQQQQQQQPSQNALAGGGGGMTLEEEPEEEEEEEDFV
eukprot:scaffold1.g5759.t1